MSGRWAGGKGDRTRPFNGERFRENFDRIFQKEDLRPVPGYEGFYSISDRGYIRSHYTGIDLAPGLDSDGYELVTLCRDKKRRTVWIHKMVALVFLGPRPDGMEVGHKDGDCRNNIVSNLKYCTHQENIDDRERHGTTARGERNGNWNPSIH